eukprot:GILJ01008707.1.p1 GENE.GILJ01008707.1~~GILJ01008707.1.p1  ORF type:complete len:685 (-),score=78.61 GILJ01008707.1:168-2222(-)
MDEEAGLSDDTRTEGASSSRASTPLTNGIEGNEDANSFSVGEKSSPCGSMMQSEPKRIMLQREDGSVSYLTTDSARRHAIDTPINTKHQVKLETSQLEFDPPSFTPSSSAVKRKRRTRKELLELNMRLESDKGQDNISEEELPLSLPSVVVRYLETLVDEDVFHVSWNDFITKRQFHPPKTPQMGGKQLDIFKLYKETLRYGGFDLVSLKKRWKAVASRFHLPASCTSASYSLRRHYLRLLYAYERQQVWGIEETETSWDNEPDSETSKLIKEELKSPVEYSSAVDDLEELEQASNFKRSRTDSANPQVDDMMTESPPHTINMAAGTNSESEEETKVETFLIKERKTHDRTVTGFHSMPGAKSSHGQAKLASLANRSRRQKQSSESDDEDGWTAVVKKGQIFAVRADPNSGELFWLCGCSQDAGGNEWVAVWWLEATERRNEYRYQHGDHIHVDSVLCRVKMEKISTMRLRLPHAEKEKILAKLERVLSLEAEQPQGTASAVLDQSDLMSISQPSKPPTLHRARTPFSTKRLNENWSNASGSFSEATRQSSSFIIRESSECQTDIQLSDLLIPRDDGLLFVSQVDDFVFLNISCFDASNRKVKRYRVSCPSLETEIFALRAIMEEQGVLADLPVAQFKFRWPTCGHGQAVVTSIQEKMFKVRHLLVSSAFQSYREPEISIEIVA